MNKINVKNYEVSGDVKRAIFKETKLQEVIDEMKDRIDHLEERNSDLNDENQELKDKIRFLEEINDSLEVSGNKKDKEIEKLAVRLYTKQHIKV